MSTSIRSLAGAATLAATVALPCGLAAQDMTSVEREVWELEEAYWRYVQAGDVERYVALWHSDFVGWPCETDGPMRKVNIGDWVRDIRDNQWTLTYELNPKAVQEFGNLAVTHYSASFVYDYGDGNTRYQDVWWKFTHTWLKDGGRWQIIGGMCGLLNTPPRQ